MNTGIYNVFLHTNHPWIIQGWPELLSHSVLTQPSVDYRYPEMARDTFPQCSDPTIHGLSVSRGGHSTFPQCFDPTICRLSKVSLFHSVLICGLSRDDSVFFDYMYSSTVSIRGLSMDDKRQNVFLDCCYTVF